MRLSRPRRAAIAICLVSTLAGVWVGWVAGEIVAQDRCLDAGGGSWNPETRFCGFGESD